MKVILNEPTIYEAYQITSDNQNLINILKKSFGRAIQLPTGEIEFGTHSCHPNDWRVFRVGDWLLINQDNGEVCGPFYEDDFVRIE